MRKHAASVGGIHSPLNARRWVKIVEGNIKRRPDAMGHGERIGMGEGHDWMHREVRVALEKTINRELFRGTRLSPLLINELYNTVIKDPKSAVSVYMRETRLGRDAAEKMLRRDLETLARNGEMFARIKREIAVKEEKTQFEKSADKALGQLVTAHAFARPILERIAGRK